MFVVIINKMWFEGMEEGPARKRVALARAQGHRVELLQGNNGVYWKV